MTDPERIIFERQGEGDEWRVRHEGADVEGHGKRFLKFSAEPIGEDDGEPLFKIDTDDDDAEGHKYKYSDRRLKRAVRSL